MDSKAIGQQSNGRQYAYQGTLAGNELSRNISHMQDRAAPVRDLSKDIDSLISSGFKVMQSEMQLSQDAMKRVAIDHRITYLEDANSIMSNQELSIDEKKIKLGQSFRQKLDASVDKIGDDKELDNIYQTEFTDRIRESYAKSMAALDIEQHNLNLSNELEYANSVIYADPRGTTKADMTELLHNNIKNKTITEDKIENTLILAKNAYVDSLYNTNHDTMVIDGKLNEKEIAKIYKGYVKLEDGKLVFEDSAGGLAVKDKVSLLNATIDKENAAILKQKNDTATDIITSVGVLGSGFEDIKNVDNGLLEIYGSADKIPQEIMLKYNKARESFEINNVAVKNQAYNSNPTTTNINEITSGLIQTEDEKKINSYHAGRLLSIQDKEQFDSAIKLTAANGNDAIVSIVASGVAKNIMSADTNLAFKQYKVQSEVFNSSVVLASIMKDMSKKNRALFIARRAIFENDVNNGANQTSITPEMGMMLNRSLDESSVLQLESKFSKDALYTDAIESIIDKPIEQQRELKEIIFTLAATGRTDLIKRAVDMYGSKFSKTSEGASIELTDEDKKMKAGMNNDIIGQTIPSITKTYGKELGTTAVRAMTSGNVEIVDDSKEVAGQKRMTIRDDNGNVIVDNFVINSNEYMNHTYNIPNSVTDVYRSNMAVDFFRDMFGMDSGSAVDREIQNTELNSQSNARKYFLGKSTTPMESTKLDDSSLVTLSKIKEGRAPSTIELNSAIADLQSKVTQDSNPIDKVTAYQLGSEMLNVINANTNMAMQTLDSDMSNKDIAEKLSAITGLLISEDYVASDKDGVIEEVMYHQNKIAKKIQDLAPSKQSIADSIVDGVKYRLSGKNTRLAMDMAKENITDHVVVANRMIETAEGYNSKLQYNVPMKGHAGLTIGGADVAQDTEHTMSLLKGILTKENYDALVEYGGKNGENLKLTLGKARDHLRNNKLNINLSKKEMDDIRSVFIKDKEKILKNKIGESNFKSIKPKTKGAILSLMFLNTGDKFLGYVKNKQWDKAVNELEHYWAGGKGDDRTQSVAEIIKSEYNL